VTPTRPDWWRAYVGGAYRWRGRDPATGVDCWGLFAHVLRTDFGRAVDDFGWAYPGDGDAGRDQARAAVDAQLPAWREVSWEEGAGVLFRVAGEPVHIAIATAQPGLVLHAHSVGGVDLLDVPNSTKWKDRFVGCFLPHDDQRAAG
jgi:cell wall-associated NlpC family hydrolase